MGRYSREKPLRLAEKLKQIRTALGLSQNGILIRLGYQNTTITRVSISNYELGKCEPPLMVQYAYAILANVYMEVLIDDTIDLPAVIPGDKKSPAGAGLFELRFTQATYFLLSTFLSSTFLALLLPFFFALVLSLFTAAFLSAWAVAVGGVAGLAGVVAVLLGPFGAAGVEGCVCANALTANTEAIKATDNFLNM